MANTGGYYISGLQSSALGICLSLILMGHANAAIVDFSISRQDLAGALNAFGIQSHREIFFAPDIVREKESQEITGELEDLKALRVILHGTGLDFSITASGAVIVIDPTKKTGLRGGPTVLIREAAAANGSEMPAAQRAVASDSGVPPTIQSSGLEEIVVTAQKRSQRLQDVPVAITALTASALASTGVEGLDDLSQAVAGLNVMRQVNNPVVFLRGVGNPNALVGNEASIATYVDGVYMPSSLGNVMEFNDIERIEVLKGPQGTLFGRNATGGLIDVITKDPSSTPALDADASYGSFHTSEARFYGTTGLTDHLAMNIAFYGLNQGDGYGRNLLTGDDSGRSKELSGRTKLLANIADDTTFILAADYTYDQSSYGWGKRNPYGIRGIDGQLFTGGYHDVALPFDPYSILNNSGLAGTLVTDIGGLKFTSISAYRSTRDFSLQDVAATQINLIDASLQSRETALSQELQLQSKQDQWMSWIVGLYFINEAALYDPATIYGPAVGGTVGYDSRLDTKSYAAFAQTTTKLSDVTNLTVGLRWTHDERRLRGQESFDSMAVLDVDASKTWSEPSWRLSLDHKVTSDILIYASYNRGFKSGTYSTLSLSDPPTNPEKLDAYEVGVKSEFFDHRLRFNGAAYLYNYRDLQLNRSLDSTTSLIELLNAGEARIRGLEGEFAFSPNQDVSMRWGVEYMPTAEYSSFADAPVYTPTSTGAIVGQTVNASGTRMIRAPKLSSNIGFSLGRDLPDMTGRINWDVNYFYTTSFYWEADENLEEAAYGIVNSELSWTSPSKAWTIGAFVKNLANRNYNSYAEADASDYTIVAAPPRTYGIRFGVKL